MNEKLIHVLLIDDDEDTFVLTKSLLARAARARYELDWVGTYEAGLEAIQSGQHDAYLVDYRLGARNGLDLVRSALDQGWSGPFIMLTNQDEHGVDLESLQSGAADYITKNWEDAAGIDRALLYALERARRDAAERKLSLAQQEFEAARLIQKRMIPQRSPHCPGWDIAGRCLSARATGGDFFDYVPLSNGRLNIVVADVSSHGFGAALVMSETRRLFRTMAKAECDLAEILTIVNQAIIEDTDDFVTLLTVQLDMRRGSFIYAGAGHDGYLLAASGEVSRLNSTSLPLGVMEDAAFEVGGPLPLSAGDIILLATDGLKEADSRDGGQLGMEQVLRVFQATRRQSAGAIVAALFEEMQTFIAGKAISDDATAVVVKCLDKIDSEPSGNHRPQATLPLEAEASPSDS